MPLNYKLRGPPYRIVHSSLRLGTFSRSSSTTAFNPTLFYLYIFSILYAAVSERPYPTIINCGDPLSYLCTQVFDLAHSPALYLLQHLIPHFFIFIFFLYYMLRCQSGRMCTLGKRVYGNVPGVQIPPAAPIKQKKSHIGFSFLFTILIQYNNVITNY